MLSAKRTDVTTGTLSYNHRQKILELNGLPLRGGEHIELYVLGHWLPGQVQPDAGGWFLMTPDNVGIRLRAGLRVRMDEHIASVAHRVS